MKARMLVMHALALGVTLFSAEVPAQEPTAPIEILRSGQKTMPSDAGLGIEFRAQIQEAAQSIQNGNYDQALAQMQPVLRYCRAQRDVPNRRSLSFATRRQYERFLAEHADGIATEWLDMGCGWALRELGYMRVEQQQPESAVAFLEEAIQIAPFDADSYIELGVARIQMRQWKQALLAYQQALAIGEAHPEARDTRAMALRGIGFAHVELGDLAQGRISYQRSLALDPGNPRALHELEYIGQLEATHAADGTATR